MAPLGKKKAYAPFIIQLKGQISRALPSQAQIYIHTYTHSQEVHTFTSFSIICISLSKLLC